MYCTICQELHYNVIKQLISHQGGTKNKGTVEEILRDTVIAQLAVQIVEFWADQDDAALANNNREEKNTFHGKSKY